MSGGIRKVERKSPRRGGKNGVARVPRGTRLRSYSMRQTRVRSLLLVLGGLDLAGAGVLLLVGGAILAVKLGRTPGAPPAIDGLLIIAFSILVAYAGALMVFNQVVVTTSRVRTFCLWWRSTPRDQIERVDIVRNDFGAVERYVPVAVLRDGREVRLLRLAWAPNVMTVTVPALGSRLTEADQVSMVHELRELLDVGGHDRAG